MSDKNNTRNLFSIINGCLPYEYDVTLLNGHDGAYGIIIVKEGSDHIVQITPSEHNNTCTVLVWADGDNPDTDGEGYQWDLDSPGLTLADILANIKHCL